MKVRIYVEGGGDNDDTITRCRQGFSLYCTKAGSEKIRPRIVPCGGRNETFNKFKTAVKIGNEDELCVLLVDSEGPVETGGASAYLSRHDQWRFPRLGRHRVFLMVQAMEAWFFADREALAEFYGKGFLAKSLPGSKTNVEAIPKNDLEPALKHASRPTKTKGEYHKVKHGFALLALIDSAKVQSASPNAAHFHDFLRDL